MSAILWPRRAERPNGRDTVPRPTVPAWSEWLVLAGLALALFYVADPFYWRLERVLLTKHLPLFLILGGSWISLTGAALFAARAPRPAPLRPGRLLDRRAAPPPAWPVIAAIWPWLLLALWIIAGSLFARRVLGIHNTFLGMGLYLLLVPLVARLVLVSAAGLALVQVWFVLATGAALLMIVSEATGMGGPPGGWHELEALVIPLAVFWGLQGRAEAPVGPAARPPENTPHHLQPEARQSRQSGMALATLPAGLWRRRGQVLLTGVFLGSALLLRKNTGYLVLLVVLGWMWWVEWAPRCQASVGFRRRAVALVTVVLVLLACAVTVLGVRAAARSDGASVASQLLPDGNNRYRLTTYDNAWRQFRAAPLAGTAFSGTATEIFTGYDIDAARGILPTHSDVLDLAAHGGILALALWLAGLVRLAHKTLPLLRQPAVPAALRPAAHALACMTVCSVIVYAFNPIMLQPVKALLLWVPTGLLLGMAVRWGEAAPGAGQGSRQHAGRPVRHPGGLPRPEAATGARGTP